MNVNLVINERQWKDLTRRFQSIYGEDVNRINKAPNMNLDYVPVKGDWIYFYVLVGDNEQVCPVSAQIEDVAHCLNAEEAQDAQKGLFLRIARLSPCKPMNPFEELRR